MEQTTDKILLRKLLENKCTEEELASARELMQKPGTNEILHEIILEQYAETWGKPLQEDQQAAQHVAKLKNKVFNQIDTDTRSSLEDADKKTRKIHFWRYAAILTGLAIGIGSYYYLNLHKEVTQTKIALIERKNPFGQHSKIILSDSSEVYLGAGSKVIFPERFTGDTREIELEGEAFFNVKKNSSHSFIVHTGTIQTRVLGTSFKINAFKGELLTVAVATGSVSVNQYRHGGSISLAILTPGHKVTWDNNTKKAIPGNVDINNLEAWQQGDLVFDNIPLAEVTKALERWYNISIEFTDNKIAAYRVNATFSSDEPIDEVMKALSIGGKFSYRTKDNRYFQIFKKN